MPATDKSVWQAIMTKAYRKWRRPPLKDKSRTDFLFHLTGLELTAVVLGTMNYQIENGGISQYICNSYGQTDGQQLLAAITLIQHDKGTIAVERRLLQRLYDNLYVLLSRDNSNYSACEAERNRGFDNWYYTKFQPVALPAIERFLQKKASHQ